MRGSSSFWMAAIVAGIGVGSSVMAAPIGQLTNEIYNSGGGYQNASSITVSTNDLLEGLMPIATNYVGTFEATGGNLGVLTDGQTASNPSNFGNAALNPNEGTSASNAAFDCGPGCGTGTAQPWYAEYDLGKTYNLSSVVVTTGHQDARVDQHYDILVSSDGVNFTSLSDGSTQSLGASGSGFVYTPSTGNGGAAQSTVSPITGSVLGTARYVEFVALNSGSDVYRELDVNGTATPEPASLSLLGLGAMGLLARRRRA